MSLTDGTDVIDVTLTVPAGAAGIYQGSIAFSNDTSGYMHNLPYSYMVVFNASGAVDEVMTVVDGVGDELTPYDNGAWSASYDAAADIRMDGGGHRTFVIEIPYNDTVEAEILVMRAEWVYPGTVVDMYLRATDYNLITESDDGYGPPFDPTPTEATANTIVWDPG